MEKINQRVQGWVAHAKHGNTWDLRRALLGEQFIEASLAEQPLSALRQADITLTKLRFYLRLCRDLHLFSLGQYEHAAQMINEIGRLLGGWIKSAL